MAANTPYLDDSRRLLLRDGDVITAAHWNTLVQDNLTTLQVQHALTVNGKRVLTMDDLPKPEPSAPSLLALASVAATAAAVSTPISRRRLLRFWRG